MGHGRNWHHNGVPLVIRVNLARPEMKGLTHMYRQLTMAPPRGSVLPAGLVITVALAVWFGLAALATPFDHDESQYVAGAYFSRHLLIFRDFLHLQPPLHSWAYAPIAQFFPEHMVVVMRLVTALTALGTLAVLWKAQRVAGIARDSAAIATLLVASTAAFQFTGSVVRNDMLPTLLASFGMLAILLAIRHRAPRYWVTAGVMFGLAIAAKLNFAPLGLATGLFVMSAGGRCGIRAALWLAAGAAIGMTPMLWALVMAPEGFIYGVLTYGATAPHAWYAANGAAKALSLTGKIADLLISFVEGPALVALVVLAANAFISRHRKRAAGRRLSIWMIAGALLGAALPTPSQLQYIMPVLPPMALALGYLLEDARHWTFAKRQTLLGLLCLSAAAGMASTTLDVADMMRNGSPVLRADRAASWAGDKVRFLASGERVATLSAHMILGSGLKLDPRFAAGPFAYRSGWTVAPALARRVHTMIPATLSDMDRAPPDAILTGYEMGTRKLPLKPDEGLIAYARSRGYQLFPMPDGVGRLYIRVPRSH